MVCGRFCVFFFFKQKTAYEMRISDWSSDVCSSDLIGVTDAEAEGVGVVLVAQCGAKQVGLEVAADLVAGIERGVGAQPEAREQIGRASCRERVCQYV